MKIYLSVGKGNGETEISAFDNALLEAGVANTNLIILSSVIPKNPEIINQSRKIEVADYGKKMYVVMAQKRTAIIGKKICAGIGYVLEIHNLFGLFVEHVGSNFNEVNNLINLSLNDMIANRKEFQFSSPKTLINETKCEKNLFVF